MIQPVGYQQLLAADDLLKEYAAECSIPEIGQINPQAQMYAAMEKAGVLQCFAALHEGQMAGFASVLIYMLPHYGKQVATVESLFIGTAFRNAGLARPLMNAIEAYAKERGCTGILYSTPAGGKLERLLELLKQYRRTNGVFYRGL